MRLTFPNGEHAAVTIEQGQIGVGSAAGGGTAIAIAGLAPLHAVFASGRRGQWLTVPQGATVIVNARPVKRLAHLRAGDLVCLGSVQVRVESIDPPPLAPEPTGPVRARRPLDEVPAVAKAVLRGLSGAWFGRSLALAMPRTLGRSAGCDVRLDSGAVLDRHAEIGIEEGGIVVRCLAPAAVLRVNGHPVKSARLSPGDQLEIGEHRFAIEAPGMAGGASAASTPVPVAASRGRPAEAPAMEAPSPPERRGEPLPRDLSGVYLLVAAAAALAAALTAFFVYAPR